MPGQLVVLLVVVVVAGVFWWYQHHSTQQRRRDLAAVAAARGWRFSVDDVGILASHEGWFELFGQGHSKRVGNVLVGTTATGHPCYLFDYRYVTGSGRNRTTHLRTAVLVEHGHRSWPHLELSREGFFSRIGDALGFPDVTFESDEFNRTWEVRCRDARFAHALIDPAMMQHLLGQSDELLVELRGGWALHYERGRVAAVSMPDLLTRLSDFLARVPPVTGELYP